jgi:hypothetical protein
MSAHWAAASARTARFFMRRKLVSEQAATSEVWESIPVGDDLGSLEYVLTAQMIADYRRVVDNPDAAYPTVAARHPANLFYRKYATVMRVPNMGHDSEYCNPPVADKRITITGRIVDKYIRRGNAYLIVEATAVDEDGRLIERSRLVGLAREVGKEAAHGNIAKKWGA